MGLSQHNTTGGRLIEDILLIDKTIYMYGGPGIFFDADGDTGIRALSDNTLDVRVAGSTDWTFTVNQLLMDTQAKLAGQGSTIASFTPIALPQELSGAGAMDIITYQTIWTTTGQDAGSMVDGAAVGQLKRVDMSVDGGTGTLTPNNMNQGSSVDFADAGGYVIFKWDGTGWVVIEKGNTIDAVSFPVIN